MIHTIQIDDRSQAARELLKQIRQVAQKTNAVKMPHSVKEPTVRKGKRKPGERITEIGRVWADDERTLEAIRIKAWPKRSE